MPIPAEAPRRGHQAVIPLNFFGECCGSACRKANNAGGAEFPIKATLSYVWRDCSWMVGCSEVIYVPLHSRAEALGFLHFAGAGTLRGFVGWENVMPPAGQQPCGPAQRCT